MIVKTNLLIVLTLNSTISIPTVRIKLYRKSLPKLQFVYSTRKVSTKLFYAPKGDEKNLDRSMRQPMSDH